MDVLDIMGSFYRLFITLYLKDQAMDDPSLLVIILITLQPLQLLVEQAVSFPLFFANGSSNSL